VNAENNVIHEITVIAATTLTLGNSTLTTEAVATITFTGKLLKNGIKRKSLLVEKHLADVDEYGATRGLRGGTMNFNIESQAIVGGIISFTGKQLLPAAASILGASQTAGITDALNATSNVGTITEGGVALTTALRSITMEIGNNLRVKPQVGNKFPVDVGYGFIDVTGNMTAYFQDRVLWEKFINHTASSLSFRFTDSAGNVLIFNLPRLYFGDGNPTTPGGNEDVLVPLDFVAVRETTRDATIILDMIAI